MLSFRSARLLPPPPNSPWFERGSARDRNNSKPSTAPAARSLASARNIFLSLRKSNRTPGGARPVAQPIQETRPRPKSLARTPRGTTRRAQHQARMPSLPKGPVLEPQLRAASARLFHGLWQVRTRDLPGGQLAAFAKRAAHPLCKFEATARAGVAPAVADRTATGFLGLAMMPAAARRPCRDGLQG